MAPVGSVARPFRFGVQCMDFSDPETVLTNARACTEHGYDEFFTADRLGAADPFTPWRWRPPRPLRFASVRWW